jgi:hypothetical protein
MSKILNITNGDCAVGIMRQANIEGIIVPWCNALHEGPAPFLPLDKLSTLGAEKSNRWQLKLNTQDCLLTNVSRFNFIMQPDSRYHR